MKHNPHIVSRLRRTPTLSKMGELILARDQSQVEVLQHLANTFQERFRRAKQAAGDLPIVYRLDVITEEDANDDISRSKIGGMPNLNAVYFPDIDRDTYRAIRPRVDTFVRRVWPRCPACEQSMIFVGQFALSNWLFVIHMLTYTASTSGRRWGSSGVSSYRLAMDHFGEMYQSWLFLFMCGDNHCYHTVPDALIWGRNVENVKATRRLYRNISKMEHKLGYKNISDVIQRRRQPVYTYKLDVLRRAVERLSLPAGERIFTIPKLRVVDFELRFDIDLGDKEFSGNSWEKIEQAEARDPDVFRREGDFQLFGSPQSQQQQHRPVCTNRYPRPHHMAPLLSWSSPDQDMTHQIYGCMACHGHDQGEKVWGIVDNSCT